MELQYIYPAAFGGPALSDWNRMLDVVPISVRSSADHRICATHWHDYLQIWYTLSGSYYHTVNGVTTLEEPGSAILVFPYVPHQINTLQTELSEACIVQINIKKDALENRGVPFLAHSFQETSFDARTLSSHIRFSGERKKRADAICMKLKEEFGKKLEINPYTMVSLTAEFLALCSETSISRQSTQKLRVARERNADISEAIRYLRANLSSELSLEEISNAAMMSRRSFTSNFRTVTGRCCGDYLRQLRMCRAVDMLRKTDKTIAQIAEECGFYDASHFNKVCTEFGGSSPLLLRRELSQWTREHGDTLYRRAIQRCSWAIEFDEAAMERHRFAMSFY